MPTQSTTETNQQQFHIPTTRLVSIIIPVYNDTLKFKQCLESIITNTSENQYDGIIINNGSTDSETLQLLSSLEGEVQIIHNPTNIGFFQACNQALAHANSKYLLFLHPDTIVQPKWLDALITQLESDPTIAMVAGNIVSTDNTASVAGCTDACLLIHRALFEKVQGFNQFENALQGLCFGLRSLGYHIKPADDALIIVEDPSLSAIPWDELDQPLPVGRERFGGLAKHKYFPAALERFLSNPVVLLELNSQCNFHCDYCRSPESPRQKSFMKKELFVHIVNQLKDITNQPLRLHVDGEPTLHPNFLELALMANDLGYTIALATNGSTLKSTFLQIDMAIILNLSCSPKELKPRSGMAFDNYLNHISDYIEAWKNSSSRQSIFLKIYTSSDERSTPGALENKFRFCQDFISRLNFEPSGWKNESSQTFEFLATNIAGGTLSLTNQARTEGGCYPTSHALPAQLLPEDYGFCDSAWKTLAVLSDGTIAFCCVDLFGETGFTDPEEIWKKPLKEIWLHHPKLQQTRRDLLEGKITIPACQKCLAIAPGRELYLWPEAFPFDEK